MSITNRIQAELRGDRIIWMIVLLLAICSVLVVYSATGSKAFNQRAGNTEFYLFKQLVMVGAGLALTYFCYKLHYMRYAQMAPILIVIAVGLLIMIFLFGMEINHAKRWLAVPGLNFTIQPSEFAKLALIVYLARSISSKQDYITDFKSAFVPIIVPVLIFCSLIAMSDLSSAILLLVISLLMMFMGRVGVQYIGLLFFLGVVLFAFMFMMGQLFPDDTGLVRVSTWVERMRDFMNGNAEVHQIVQSKIAIASGEIIGAGPGNSVSRNLLPHSYSDFIYSIICEEYGLLGAMAVVGLYIGLFFRTVVLVTRSPKAFGAMVALGVSLSFVLQAFINMAVSVNLLPVTGITLPMISMGGTSLIFTSISFGIILSVSRHIEKN